jgi:hypothetical protein
VRGSVNTIKKLRLTKKTANFWSVSVTTPPQEELFFLGTDFADASSPGAVDSSEENNISFPVADKNSMLFRKP